MGVIQVSSDLTARVETFKHLKVTHRRPVRRHKKGSRPTLGIEVGKTTGIAEVTTDTETKNEIATDPRGFIRAMIALATTETTITGEEEVTTLLALVKIDMTLSSTKTTIVAETTDEVMTDIDREADTVMAHNTETAANLYPI